MTPKQPFLAAKAFALARRSRALLLDAKASIAMAPEVAQIMAEELSYDEKWQKGQVDAYTSLAHGYLLA